MASTYQGLGAFIGANNPYAPEDKVELPDLTTNLAGQGVQFAGWLRDVMPEDPIVSSDGEMTIDEKRQCFYWDVRHPDIADPANADPAKRNGGDVINYQIAKVIRIPYTYVRKDGKTLRAHLLIGFEGAGGM